MTRRPRVLLSLFLPTLLVAAPAGGVAKYKNCAALNVEYPHGIGLAGAVDKTKSEPPVTTFTVNAALYKTVRANLDRDKDGIACEKL